jgi:hypothetical protein
VTGVVARRLGDFMTTASATERFRGLTGGSKHLTRLAALVIAYIGCAIVWLIADPIGGTNLKVEAMGGDIESLNLLGVLTSIASYGIVAWIVLMLIERFAPAPRKTWLVVSVIVLLLSFITAYAGGVSDGTSITLIAMHLVAGAAIIPIFASTLPERRGEG